jgi:hypothetical protein
MLPSELESLGTSMVSDVQTLTAYAQRHPDHLALIGLVFVVLVFTAAFVVGTVYGRFHKDPRSARLLSPSEIKKEGFIK